MRGPSPPQREQLARERPPQTWKDPESLPASPCKTKMMRETKKKKKNSMHYLIHHCDHFGHAFVRELRRCGVSIRVAVSHQLNKEKLLHTKNKTNKQLNLSNKIANDGSHFSSERSHTGLVRVVAHQIDQGSLFNHNRALLTRRNEID